MPRLALVALACLLVSCGGTEPNDDPPEPGDAVGVWNMALSNLPGFDPATRQPITCIAQWISAIPEDLFFTVPYNASIQCGTYPSGTWFDRGTGLFIEEKGDSLVFLTTTRLDTFAVAGFESASSLRGRGGSYLYRDAVFTATRRSGADPNAEPWLLEIQPSVAEIEITEDVPLSFFVYDAYFRQLDQPAVVWTSSDDDVATVSGAGVIHGVATGHALVIGRMGEAADTVEVEVLVPPASIEIASPPDSLIEPQTRELDGIARDANGQMLPNRRFHWSSSDPAVATVQGESIGFVTAVGPGTVTITAQSGTLTTSATFTVLAGVAEIEVTGGDGTVPIGGSVQLSVVTRDRHGNILTGRPVTSWQADGVGRITVDENGLAHGLRGGRERITAQLESQAGTLDLTAVMDAPLVQVANGYGHSCGLSGSGTVYCWGHAEDGQLGPGRDGGPPVPIAAPEGFVSIAAGGLHTCARTAAGTAYCWGRNAWGELGQTPGGDPGALQQVSGGVSFASLTAGEAFTCGLTAAGQAFCWGANNAGQLGRGTVDESTHPAPAAVAGGHAFTELRAGPSHACGIEADGDAWCWGSNEHAVLGIGDDDLTPQPTPVHAATGLRFAAIAPGSNQTCGITTDGPVSCWGVGSPDPAPLDNRTGFVAIVAGFQHHCRLDTAGMVSCWGDLEFGLDFEPQVAIASVAAGVHTTCVIPVSGKAFCWGLNDGSQLGDYSGDSGPVEIAGQP